MEGVCLEQQTFKVLSMSALYLSMVNDVENRTLDRSLSMHKYNQHKIKFYNGQRHCLNTTKYMVTNK